MLLHVSHDTANDPQGYTHDHHAESVQGFWRADQYACVRCHRRIVRSWRSAGMSLHGKSVAEDDRCSNASGRLTGDLNLAQTWR
jgi:hypothetical protein